MEQIDVVTILAQTVYVFLAFSFTFFLVLCFYIPFISKVLRGRLFVKTNGILTIKNTRSYLKIIRSYSVYRNTPC